MIEVNHITKRFGKVTAVDDFTLDINRGSVLGIVGSNGGGKSTLLRILSGVFDADSGEVKINGQNIYNNPSVKGECFFIPDFPYFSNSATLENTAYLYRSLYPNWNENAFKQFCSVFPIDPDAKIIDMSKGMQRQAALILAISTCPRYLLLDEIFDGLDPVVRRLVKKILIDNVSANDMTVVIASQNLRELEELCDRICLIHKGKLLLEREIDEIKLGLRKVQVAFTEVPDNSFFEEINVINLWRNGNIFNLTIRGTEDEFMPKFFQTVDKIKPAYDITYKIVLFICKLLLTADLVITSVCVVGRYVPFVPDPAWSEEVVLTLMSYMAVLSAALAIRRNAHIRMTAFDQYLPKSVIRALDILADVAVLILGVVMITVGFSYAVQIGAKGNYVSMPSVSKFWMYFPIPLAGIAMVVFEIEAVYNHIKGIFVKEEK